MEEIQVSVPAQIESALLSCCMQSDICVEACMERNLQPSDFSAPLLGELWRAVMELYTDNTCLDRITTIHWLATHTNFPEGAIVASIDGIIHLIQSPTQRQCEAYLACLLERANIRKLRISVAGILQSIEQPQTAAQMIISRAEQALMDLNDGSEYITHVRELVPNAMEALQTSGQMDAEGILTGLPRLDSCLHGIKPGQMMVIAARPSMGKTALALNIARNMGMNDVPSLFISLEMSSSELATRLIGMCSAVNLRAYRDGYTAAGTLDKLQRAAMELSRLPIIFDDYCMQGTQMIASLARRMQRKYGIRALIVDYLQLITPRITTIPREQQIAEISRSLKFMAKSLALPVICLAQLNRAAEIEARVPRLSDLRESGTIEQDADIVAFLDREDDVRRQDETTLRFVARDLIIAKNRSGETDRVPLLFDRATLLFSQRTSVQLPDGEGQVSNSGTQV